MRLPGAKYLALSKADLDAIREDIIIAFLSYKSWRMQGQKLSLSVILFLTHNSNNFNVFIYVFG